MTSFDDSHQCRVSRAKMQLYPDLDENGEASLPCRKRNCAAEDGTPYIPAPTKCANDGCEKRFRHPCPGVIYCCRKCFEATNTQEAWDQAKPETREEQRKREKQERKKQHLQTPEGKIEKSEENKRCHHTRQANGKSREYYTRNKPCRLECNRQGNPDLILILEGAIVPDHKTLVGPDPIERFPQEEVKKPEGAEVILAGLPPPPDAQGNLARLSGMAPVRRIKECGNTSLLSMGMILY